MKNNILIIAIVTVAALGVIVAVILASVLNGEDVPSDSSEESFSQSVDVPDFSEPFGSSEDNSAPIFSSDASSLETSDPDSSQSGISEAQGIIATASALIGVPFVENGSTPDGFDNSGFIYYVLRENGYITCPRGTEAQSVMGARLEYDEIKEGDLVFFTNGEGGETASIGGIYIGNGKMIACLMPGTLVREVDITVAYYKENFFGGVSLT